MDGGFFRQKHGVKSGDLAIDLQRSNSHAIHANALLPAWLPAHTPLRRVQVKREFSTKERPVRGWQPRPGRWSPFGTGAADAIPFPVECERSASVRANCFPRLGTIPTGKTPSGRDPRPGLSLKRLCRWGQRSSAIRNEAAESYPVSRAQHRCPMADPFGGTNLACPCARARGIRYDPRYAHTCLAWLRDKGYQLSE